MPLRRGVNEIKSAIDRARTAGQGNRIPVSWFTWEDGETKTLRFLTDSDQVFVVFQHDYVLSHDGKRRTYVCRKEFEAECELCVAEAKRREVGYGIAVLRKEVAEEVDGRRRVVGYADYTEEVEVEEGGKTVVKIRPVVGVVRQAPGNFWIFIDAIYEKFGSLCDRDIDIQRKGGDKSTTYLVFPDDPVEIPNLKGRVDGDKTIPGRYDKYVPDLQAMLEGLGAEAYYQQHLHGVKSDRQRAAEGQNGGQPNQTPAQQASAQDMSDQPYEATSDRGVDNDTEFDRLRRQQAELMKQESAGGTYS